MTPPDDIHENDGAQLDAALSDYDYDDGALGLAAKYDSDFTDYYAQEYPDKAARLTALLQAEKDEEDSSVSLIDALNGLDAVLPEYAQVKEAREKEAAEKKAAEKAKEEAERERLGKEIQTELNDLDFGAGVTIRLEWLPNRVAQVTVKNPTVGPAGALVLRTNGPYVDEDTPWTIVDSGCDYDSGTFGASALSRASDDVYALETQLRLIKSGEVPLEDPKKEAPFHKLGYGFLAFRAPTGNYAPDLSFGQIEASNTEAFVAFANARYHIMTHPKEGAYKEKVAEWDSVVQTDLEEISEKNAALAQRLSSEYEAALASGDPATLESAADKVHSAWAELYPEKAPLTVAAVEKEWFDIVDLDLREIAETDPGRAKAFQTAYMDAATKQDPQALQAVCETIHQAWEGMFPDKAASREAPAPAAPSRPRVAPAFAPAEAQKTFRERLSTNQSAAPEAKDANKPSFTPVDKNGVKEVTLHLPTAQDVRDSRITDFVGKEGLAIKLSDEELARTTVKLMADSHGQKAGTEYTWKDGTWKNAAGDRLKVYDGTKVSVDTKKDVPAAPPPEAQAPAVEAPKTITQADLTAGFTGKGHLVQEGTYGEGGRPVTRTVDGTFDKGRPVGDVHFTNVTVDADGTKHTSEKTIHFDAPIDLAQFNQDNEDFEIKDNRTLEQKATALDAEYKELKTDADKEAAAHAGVLPDSFVARYRSSLERTTAFIAAAADKEATYLAPLKANQTAMTELLKKYPEKEPE